jgi:hypothetical protein
MQGRTWFDKVWSRNALTRDESLRLALHCASVLVGLEGLRLAHCDISGANVIFDPVTFAIALIDVEDMYGEYRPGEPFTQPASVPLGTPGYQHRTSARGQWGAEADRFAGAVLLAEMLGWYDDRVRTEASGESYFEPTELQQPGCPRFGVLREALAALGGPLAALLDRAWRSSALAECPSLAEWRYHIESVSPHAAAAPSSGPVTGWRLPPPVQGVEPEPVTWNGKLRMDGPAASPTPVVFKSLPPSLAVAPPVTGWARPSVDQGIVARQPTFWGTRKPRAEKT